MTFTKNYSLVASGFAKNETAEIKSNLDPYTDKIPTGIYVKKGDQIQIDVSGQFVNAHIGTPEYLGQPTNSKIVVTALANGKNTFVAQSEGILYLENNSLSQAASIKITAPDTVEQTILITKEHTAEDVQRMLAANPTAKAVEIQGDRMFLTVTYDSAKQYLKDPQALIKRWDEIINTEDDIAGLTTKTNGVNQSSTNMYHGIEVSDKNYMYATNGYSAYAKGYPASIMLSADSLTIDGWGPWHEIGHQHQLKAMTWQSMSEVAENLYSVFVDDQTAGKTLLHADVFPADKFFAVNPGMVGKTYNDFGNFPQLALLAQMYLAFGKEFYQSLHQYYRTQTAAETKTSTVAMMDDFALATSKISGFDLRPLYSAWKFPISPAVIDQIAALNLKTLPLDLANYAVKKTDGHLADKLGLYTEGYITPDATPHHGSVFKAETTINPSDLISYDKSLVKTASFFEPLDTSTAGVKNAKVLIEDYQGHKNIIPVQILIVPKTYADTSDLEIVTQATADINASINQEAPSSTSPVKQIVLLQSVNEMEVAHLMSYTAKYAAQGSTRALSYIEALSGEDVIQTSDGYAKLKISNEQLTAIKDFGDLEMRIYVDDRYSGTFYVKTKGISPAYSGRYQELDGNTYFYSVEALQTGSYSKVKYELIYNTKTGSNYQSTFHVNKSELGNNVIHNFDTIVDSVFATQSNGMASVAIDHAFYQEIKADGDLKIKMYLNGQYQGEVAEFENAETAYYSSAFKETVNASIFSLTNKAIYAGDKLSFEVNYQQQGSSTNQQKTLNYFGSELGFFNTVPEAPKVTLADVMANIKIDKYSSKFAGVSFAKSFYDQMEADGDVTILMYVNKQYVGEVSEVGNAETQYYGSRFATSTSTVNFYLEQLGIKSTDQLSFVVNYKQNGAAISSQTLNFTGAEAGFETVPVPTVAPTPAPTIAPTPAPTTAPAKMTLTDVMANLKVEKIDGKFAGISFTKDFYTKMENAGDSMINMMINGRQIGVVMESNGIERQYSSGKYSETATNAQFYLNLLSFKSTDQFSFNVFYKSVGSTKYDNQIVKFTGADLLKTTAKMMAFADEARTEISVVDGAVGDTAVLSADVPAEVPAIGSATGSAGDAVTSTKDATLTKTTTTPTQQDMSNAVKFSSLVADEAGLTLLVKADQGGAHAQSSQQLYEGGQTWSNISRLDLNHDKVIDVKDAVFAELKVWHDQNHDMLLTDNELHSLGSLGVQSLGLVDVAAKASTLGDVQLSFETEAESSRFTVL